MNDIYVLKNSNIDYLKELFLDNDKNLIVRPYDEIKDIPQEHLSLFCRNNGIYSLPTREMIDFLLEEIGEHNLDKTIEIAAGNGVYSRELGIIGTDSYMQADDSIKNLYNQLDQSPVIYGEHVQKLDAKEAIKKYKPNIVVASWCTHRYNPKEHWRGGNSLGVNEGNLITKVEKYIHIGNQVVHKYKPILKKPHRTIKEKWIISRSIHSNENCIYIWD